MNRFVRLAAAALCSAACFAAQAKVVGWAVHPGNFSFTTPTALVPLSNAGGVQRTSLSFDIPQDGIYLMTYSAECAVDAPSGVYDGWVDLDVIIDGDTLDPSSSDAFCSADGTAGFGRWGRRSVTVAMALMRGLHTFQVQARLNGATGAWLGDGSLVLYP